MQDNINNGFKHLQYSIALHIRKVDTRQQSGILVCFYSLSSLPKKSDLHVYEYCRRAFQISTPANTLLVAICRWEH